MRLRDINIRDPFVLRENGKYYMYGTRGANFGQLTGGFDVYVSTDLKNWSDPIPCFYSEKHGMNRCVNWAPEVHEYKGKYYLFATFTRENGLRGTFALVSDRPEGPFAPHSDGPLTPEEWECLDGTLYVDKNGRPYLVFCHEHTQIINGTVCYVPLTDDLRRADGGPVLIFSATDPFYVRKNPDPDVHYVTDGPFMFRTNNGTLLMLWSTFPGGKYAECVARSDNGEIDGHFEHLDPIITNDGGHGMIFRTDDCLMLTYHSPNTRSKERPVFRKLIDEGDRVRVVD